MNVISVIMSTFNESENNLRQSIESILNQTYASFEFIIVLDNPENLEIKKTVYEYANKDKRIIVLENERNIGLTNSLNKALEYCKGKYIARMDADDISDKDRLERQLNYLEKYRYDLIGSKIRRIDENGQMIQKLSNHPVSNRIINSILKYDNCVPHPTWLAKKEVYLELNGYRNFHTCEDYDFLLRCKKKYRIGNYNHAVLTYRMNAKSISRSNALKQLLSVHYLQKNIKNIELITQDELEEYVEKKKINSMKMQKYDKAQRYFIKALLYKENRNKIKMFYNLALALISSRYFLIRCKNMLAIKLIKLVKG